MAPVNGDKERVESEARVVSLSRRGGSGDPAKCAQPGDSCGHHHWLTRLVGDPAEFFSGAWSDRPLLHRGHPSQFNDVFNIDSLMTLVSMGVLSGDRITLIKSGMGLPAWMYSSHRRRIGGTVEMIADSAKLRQLMQSGYSLKILDAHEISEGTFRLCSGLQAELSHRVRAAVFFTPPGSYALRPHYDSHDVIVMQVHGQKDWRIYDRHADSPGIPKNVPVQVGQTPVLEARLLDGDTLYVPRGFVHNAVATEQPSIHVAVGIERATVADLVKYAVDKLSSYPEFSRELAPGFAVRPADMSALLADGAISLTRQLAAAPALVELMTAFCRDWAAYLGTDGNG